MYRALREAVQPSDTLQAVTGCGLTLNERMKSASHRAVHIKVLYNSIFVCVCVCRCWCRCFRWGEDPSGEEEGLLSDSVFDWLTLSLAWGWELAKWQTVFPCLYPSVSFCLASCLLDSSLSVFLPVSLSVYRTVPPSQRSLQACGYFTPLMIPSTREGFTIHPTSTPGHLIVINDTSDPREEYSDYR